MKRNRQERNRDRRETERNSNKRVRKKYMRREGYRDRQKSREIVTTESREIPTERRDTLTDRRSSKHREKLRQMEKVNTERESNRNRE